LRRTFIAAIFSIFFVSLEAQSEIPLTAGDLEKVCESKDESEYAGCAMITMAFRDGYIEGAGTGVIGAYTHDTKVFKSVKDMKMKEFVPRITSVTQKSTCIQKTTVIEMINAFVAHMRSHPELRTGHYRAAMFRMIQEHYCNKKSSSIVDIPLNQE
jgi:hypothetical protein